MASLSSMPVVSPGLVVRVTTYEQFSQLVVFSGIVPAASLGRRVTAPPAVDVPIPPLHPVNVVPVVPV